jgi:hypothetical protein
MPLSFGYGADASPDPVEFTVEDALLNTWVDEGDYLQLEGDDLTTREGPLQDQS